MQTSTVTEQRPPTTHSPRPGGVSLGSPGACLAWILAAGVLFDLAMETRAQGTAAFSAAVVVACAAVATGAARSRWGVALFSAALVPAAFLPLRQSPWLVTLDLLASFGLFVLAASFAASGNPFDVSFAHLGRRVTASLGRCLRGGVIGGRLLGRVVGRREASGGRRGDLFVGVLKGALLALPLMLLLGALLASADAVFASFFRISFDFGTLPAHVFFVVSSAAAAAGLLHAATDSETTVEGTPAPRIGHTEACVVLGGMVALYSLFALSRLLVALRGDEYVLDTTGLTYAEYARSGFFQLLFVAGVTLVTLILLGSTVRLPTRQARRTFKTLALVAVALTLVVVQSAIVRLGLYEEAFGLTMLRLYSTAFAWWLGLVFVLAGGAIAGVRRSSGWLPGAIGASALGLLVALNVWNPEAAVVRHNVERAEAGASFDHLYATGLSDDALPTYVELVLEPGEDSPLHPGADEVRLLCRWLDDDPVPWNLSAIRADEALEETCGSE